MVSLPYWPVFSRRNYSPPLFLLIYMKDTKAKRVCFRRGRGGQVIFVTYCSCLRFFVVVRGKYKKRWAARSVRSAGKLLRHPQYKGGIPPGKGKQPGSTVMREGLKSESVLIFWFLVIIC